MNFVDKMAAIMDNPNYPLTAGRTDIKPMVTHHLDFPLPDNMHLAYTRGDPEWAEVQAGADDWLQIRAIENGGRFCYWSIFLYEQDGQLDTMRMENGAFVAFGEIYDVLARLDSCDTLADVEQMLRTYGVLSQDSE